MTWSKLILAIATELWDAIRSRKPEEPAASQRDIAIGVASGEAARREGKIAAAQGYQARGAELGLGAQAGHAPRRTNSTDEDTWPGERK